MANVIFINTATDTSLPLQPVGGDWQISVTGDVPAGGSVVLYTSLRGSGSWAPAGRDVIDAALPVPGSVVLRASQSFDYRITTTGAWTAESISVHYEQANG